VHVSDPHARVDRSNRTGAHFGDSNASTYPPAARETDPARRAGSKEPLRLFVERSRNVSNLLLDPGAPRVHPVRQRRILPRRLRGKSRVLNLYIPGSGSPVGFTVREAPRRTSAPRAPAHRPRAPPAAHT